MKRFITIGMAGHIDHGKTSLTKALTNVDTDRLKEEKDRNISIEPGYAPFINNDSAQISIVDVPGHEKFIRQMIAGVAGIDLVILAVAADEGVMPQTKEHLEILSFLGIDKGIVAITKMDKVESELLELAKEEILLELEGTIFADAPCVYIDSLSGKGISELKAVILSEVETLRTKNSGGDFRLPIDQVFTLRGQGTIVRGTVFEGEITQGSEVYVLPQKVKGTLRTLQVQHQQVDVASAGQRAALNLAGINRNEVRRGDVVVSNPFVTSTETIDVAIRFVKDLQHPVKQRMVVSCHVGTSEVRGTIVFFDRNEVIQEDGEVLCQIRLEEPIVVRRGDRLILRRPSPSETIAGGWIIEANSKKYKFGKQTISALQVKKEGSHEDRVLSILKGERASLPIEGLSNQMNLPIIELQQAIDESKSLTFIHSKHITHTDILEEAGKNLVSLLDQYHHRYPMRMGMNKAEIGQEMRENFTKEIVESLLEDSLQAWTRTGQFIKLKDFEPHVPKQWGKRAAGFEAAILEDGYQVRPIDDYFKEAGIPEQMTGEMLNFLEKKGRLISLSEKIWWSREVFELAVKTCKEHNPSKISIPNVKEHLNLSRKYLIPFLEKMDSLGLTRREDDERIWVS